MPWPVMGSRWYPASPTSAHPGPAASSTWFGSPDANRTGDTISAWRTRAASDGDVPSRRSVNDVQLLSFTSTAVPRGAPIQTLASPLWVGNTPANEPGARWNSNPVASRPATYAYRMAPLGARPSTTRAPTARATRERTPSAPTTNRARTSPSAPLRFLVDTPTTRPVASVNVPVTLTPVQIDAPAA